MFRLVAVLLCAGAAQAADPLVLTLDDAIARAKANAPQLLSANIAVLLAKEDTVQAKAALLPSVSGVSQYVYTQTNAPQSLIFVSNDAPNLYNNQVAVHGDIYSPTKLADYRRTRLAEEITRARAEVTARGLVATVVQNYYAMAAAARRIANAQQSEREAARFADITRKQEAGGEVAHADTVKAEIQLIQRRRDTQEARLGLEKARLAFAVLLFPDFRQDFTVADDLDAPKVLPGLPEIQAMAAKNSPDVRAAQATVEAESFDVKSAKAARLPSVSFDYFYGMNSGEFAIHNRDGLLNLGNAAQAQLTIPLWTWGAARSRIRQAELRMEQARNDLKLTQRSLLANLNAFYLEADAAQSQLGTLRRSLELSAESLKLAELRYQAGEATVLEVVDAQTTLVQARNALDDGAVRYRVALAAIETVTGAF